MSVEHAPDVAISICRIVDVAKDGVFTACRGGPIGEL